MQENPLLSATKTWIEAVKAYYKNNNELTQIYMRGYFAGWSEFEILELANRLHKNQQDYPIYEDK
jgi:hypothetical protein